MDEREKKVALSTGITGYHDSTASCAAPSDAPSGEYVWELGKALPPVVRARTDLPEQLDQSFTCLRGTVECFNHTDSHKQG